MNLFRDFEMKYVFFLKKSQMKYDFFSKKF
jgi:hypothetical protein